MPGRPNSSAAPQPALRTRDAYQLGVTRGELAGPGWRSPHRGVQTTGGTDATSPLQRIWDAAELLPPGAALGGWAAAFLQGARFLDGRGPSGLEKQPVAVVLPPPLLIRARPGIVRWRHRLTDDDMVLVGGIPCTTLIRTAFDLGRLQQLRLGVAALDIIGQQCQISALRVAAYADDRRRWKGLPALRSALTLTDPRAESPGETRLRLIWVLDAGLPRPQVNPGVFDGDRWFLGRPDLLDVGTGLVGEYDGAYHRDRETHAHDNAREEWMEDSGLTVVRASDIDVGRERRRTVARLVTAHNRAAGRDRNADRWTWRAKALLE
jgi:Protein of unknown function (DUF559)